MLTHDQWKLRAAELALEAKLSAVLDPTFAAAAAKSRAQYVTVSDDGVVDAGALEIQYAITLREAPPKMRNDYRQPRENDAEFYDRLRAAVAARHEAQHTGGTDEVARRLGNL